MLSIALALLLGRELEWERLQVEWIASTETVTSLEDVMPTRQAELVRLLGDKRYVVRLLASEELQRQGKQASGALAWGMRCKDREIADAAGQLRGLLYVCQHCMGGGICPACVATRDGEWPRPDCPENCAWPWACVVCSGSGDVRDTLRYAEGFWNVEWIPHKSGYLPAPRDLFGADVTAMIDWWIWFDGDVADVP